MTPTPRVCRVILDLHTTTHLLRKFILLPQNKTSFRHNKSCRTNFLIKNSLRVNSRYQPPKHLENLVRGTKTVGKQIIQMPMRRGGRRGRRRAVTRVKRQYAEANINQGVKINAMLEDTGLQQMGTKDLKQQNLTIIAQGTEINERERQTVRIVGVKIDGFVKNSFGVAETESPQKPLVFNMAIVFPKHDITLPTSNFFRREGGQVRGQEFYDTGNLCGMDYITKQINSDKIGVLWRKKFWLNNAVTSSGYASGAAGSTKMFTKYIKLYRSVQYTGSGADSCDDKLYLIWWCASPSESTGSGANTGCYYQLRVRTYFRDPKN